MFVHKSKNLPHIICWHNAYTLLKHSAIHTMPCVIRYVNQKTEMANNNICFLHANVFGLHAIKSELHHVFR